MPLIMNTGLIGAITGVTIGCIGGIIGTYCSIKNTNGPKEKAFMVKAIKNNAKYKNKRRKSEKSNYNISDLSICSFLC